jgi:hypothetical protein
MIGSPFFLNRAMAELIASTLCSRLAFKPELEFNHSFWTSITNSAGFKSLPNCNVNGA